MDKKLFFKESRIRLATYVAVQLLQRVRSRRMPFEEAKVVVDRTVMDLAQEEIILHLRTHFLDSDNPEWSVHSLSCDEWDAFKFFGVL